MKVLVIGGGLAGLAAASVLAPAGVRVTLLESRNRLGGRASSFRDPASDRLVDNCQHVSMGCCTNLKDFCSRMGIDSLLASQRWLYFQDERGKVSRFGAWPLPCPLHLGPTFLSARFLTLSDKLRIAYGFWRLLRTPRIEPGRSFEHWLLENGQTRRTCDRFWGLILVSALNETLGEIDFRYARQVFVEGFLWNRDSSVVEIPQTTLGELYGDRLRKRLEGLGVDIQCNRSVKRLEFDGDAVGRCVLRGGETFAADSYVLAVPFQRATSLLPESVVAEQPIFSNIDRLRSSPITSVHMWFDRPVMNRPHLVPVGRTVQWLFVRGEPSETGSAQGMSQYVQAVISASDELASLGNEEAGRRVLEEFRQILPAARHAELLRHRVVTERSATYSVVPDSDRWRPPQTTPIRNLWLAGDYTQTGWPATMEGAVRSGYLAAEQILESAGRPVAAVQPPLPVSRLTRWLLRQ